MSLIVSNESKVRAAGRMSETDLTGQSGPADSRFISALQAGVLYDCFMTAFLFPNICWSFLTFWKSTCQSKYQLWFPEPNMARLCLRSIFWCHFSFCASFCSFSFLLLPVLFWRTVPLVFLLPVRSCTCLQPVSCFSLCYLMFFVSFYRIYHLWKPERDATNLVSLTGPVAWLLTCPCWLDRFGASPMDGVVTYAQRDHLYTCWKHTVKNSAISICSNYNWSHVSARGPLCCSCINNNRLCTY